MLKIFKDLQPVFLAAAIGIAAAFSLGWAKQKKETERYRQNLYVQESQWKDEQGRLITEVSELRFTNRELQAVTKMDSAKLNKVQKDLLKANQTIQELGIKLKDAESYFKGELKAQHDSLTTTIDRDSTGQITALKPIKTAYLEIEFDVVSIDTIKIRHLYKTNIETVVNRKEDKTTKNGNKRFFVARWIKPRYDYWATTRAEDPDAEINNSVYINFE